MGKSSFWLITLCVLLILSSILEPSIPLRIAIGANAIIIIINLINKVREEYSERFKKKNQNLDRGEGTL